MNMERTMALPSQQALASLIKHQAMGSEVAGSSQGRASEDEALMIKVDSSPGSCVAKEIHVHHHEVDNTILDNMKARSKSTLKDFNMATFHPTKAVQAAREHLQYGYVCLEGKPKSGKSSIGLYLLATFADKNYTPLILNNPDEYSHISQREKTVVLIDDIFGSRVFMPEMVIRWNKVLQNMFHDKSTGRTFLIITSENGFLERSHAFVSFDDFLDKTHRVKLQNPDLLLRDYEKFAILEKLASFKRLTQDCKLLTSVVNASNHPWFFDCCKYLSKKKLPLKDWAEFFRHPLAVLCEHIAKLDQIKTALLILIMKHSHIMDADFSSPTDRQIDLTASFDILSRIMDLPRGSDMKDMRNAAQSLNGDLVVYRDQQYCFAHDAVQDAVCFTFSKIAPVYFIQWCPLDYLIRHTVTEAYETRVIHSVKIDSSLFQNLRDRIVQDFTKGLLEHDAFKDEKFVCLFFQNNQVLDDVEHITAMASSCGKHGHAFFLNQILLFIAGFEEQEQDIEHIKHEALEKACSYRQASVANILLDANAKPCDVCFMKACDGQMLTVVKRCLSTGPPSWSNNLAALVNTLRNTDCVTDITAVLLNVTNWNAEGRGLAIMASVCETGNWELYHVISESLIDGTLTCRDLLPHAIRGGSLLIVSDLIRKDPNILILDNGESAFFMACRYNKMELVRLIWDEYSVTSRSRIYEEGRSSLRALQIAVLASSDGLDLLKWLLDEGFPVNACGGSSRTPLHTACHEGTVGVIKLLLDRQADISAIDADGNTMLHLVCGRDDTSKDIIRLLLRSGANISSLNKENKTPLHVLCEKRHDSRSVVISHLLECEAPVNSLDMHGRTPLHLLLNGGFCLEEVELLIENGTKVGLKDHFQETAIHAACRSSKCSAIKIILENGGVLQARDQHGLSCLHHAVSVMNNGDVVKYLLQRGLLVNTVDTYGNTPLHSAVQVPFNKMVVELLMEMEADSTLTNQEGYAPLHLVCMDSLDYSLEYVGVLKTKSRLLTTKENNTPLHLACMSFGESALSVVKELLDSDAYVSERNVSGKTALHIVCERSDEPGCSIAETLCTSIAELDCQDNERDTPLHLACLSEGDSRLRMIKFLIKQGAKVSIRNDQHLSPIDIIEDRKDDREILMLMIDSMLNQACHGNGRYTMEEIEDALSKEKELSLLDKEQRPVLHRICSINGQQSPAIISMLLQQGADIAEKAKDGLTALHSACMAIGPFTELVLETLVRSGGDVNERDDHGQTAFHKACTVPDNHTENVLGKLQQYGIDVNLPDGQGNTPLHLVCSSTGGHIRHRIKWLLDQGADWQYQNHDGHTPYDIANDEMRKVLMNLVLLRYCETSAFFESDVIVKIVQKGADVNCQNNDGNTILHVVSQNHGEFAFENISLMVSLGSDKALLNNAGMTAYEVGIDVGLDEAVLRLLCPDEQDNTDPHAEGACGGPGKATQSGKVHVDHLEKLRSTATNFKDLLGEPRTAQLVECTADMVGSAAAFISKWVKES
ncbi:ankyrin-3-like [Haliotis asinina]|uniref:ankyrin-3-like n=1 Tax=Haliotis asinina TaxID=109174 RepID=UPI0035325E63